MIKLKELSFARTITEVVLQAAEQLDDLSGRKRLSKTWTN